jgi:N-methylhydantoinase A
MEGEVDAVAVVFLFSFMDDRHEREAAEILSERLPGLPITISSRVSPEFREYPRTSTTVLNAGLLPVSGEYIAALSERLRESGFEAPLQLMRSNGGVVSAGAAASLPVGLIASGPAAGVVGAAHLIRAAGIEDAVTLDIGGTTADVSLILGGQPQRRFQGDFEGVPVNLPQIDVLSIGAGGGSIARVDKFGALTVGPESAGAEPGPAADGRGGELPTVTDAHLVLGNLDPSRFLGGEMALDTDAARAAVERHVARPLAIEVPEAAAAIVRMADVKMANALRVVTVARGQDPRRCTLVAFGGAGPMHACSIAEELDIERILVPRFPGLTSALGLIMSDGRYDFARTHIVATADADIEELRSRIAAIEAEANAMLDEAGARAAATLTLELDMRYRGQAYQLTVAVPTTRLDREVIAGVERDFHDAHDRIYGHAWPGNATEIVTLRLCARTPRTPPDWAALLSADGAARQPSSRDVWTDQGICSYAVHDRLAVSPGLSGPLLIEQDDSTVVVHAGWRVDDAGAASLLLERDEPKVEGD